MVCTNYIFGSCLRHFIINAQFSVGCASTSSATTTHGYRPNMPTALKKLVEKGYYLSKKIVSLATLLPRKFTPPNSKTVGMVCRRDRSRPVPFLYKTCRFIGGQVETCPYEWRRTKPYRWNIIDWFLHFLLIRTTFSFQNSAPLTKLLPPKFTPLNSKIGWYGFP